MRVEGSLFLWLFMICLKLTRAYFHLRLFHTLPLPVKPHNSSKTSQTCTQVRTIEVGTIAALVPPTACVRHSAKSANIIFTILGTELHPVLISERISCVSFLENKQKLQDKKYFTKKENNKRSLRVCSIVYYTLD